MNNLSDVDLLSLMQDDNEEAFSVLMDRYADVLFRFVSRRIKSISDTEDILQEIFVSLWKNRHRISIKDSFYPYLFKSAKYESIDWLVSHKNRIANEHMLMLSLAPGNMTRSAEEELLAKELEEMLEMEVNKMPDTMKSVFFLSRKKNLSIKEIALQLSVSEQTVKNNISLALNRLRLKIK
ncbi:RNA polymerase sigma factor [Parapedobacter deserti]|uniref:RNA polymerase sigma factor n=1 Tax=Parapedobacter deserti TaxID=1912957 RepID=A0ABV7JSM6_9SPHI